MFALQFLVHGAASGESGVFVTFEETEEDLLRNAAPLGYDLPDLINRKRILLEYIRVERSEIEETGNTTSKASSSAWTMPCGPFARVASCSTPLNRSLPDSAMPAFCARNCGASLPG